MANMRLEEEKVLTIALERLCDALEEKEKEIKNLKKELYKPKSLTRYDAILILRGALRTGLYEAKQIFDADYPNTQVIDLRDFSSYLGRLVGR